MTAGNGTSSGLIDTSELGDHPLMVILSDADRGRMMITEGLQLVCAAGEVDGLMAVLVNATNEYVSGCATARDYRQLLEGLKIMADPEPTDWNQGYNSAIDHCIERLQIVYASQKGS